MASLSLDFFFRKPSSEPESGAQPSGALVADAAQTVFLILEQLVNRVLSGCVLQILEVLNILLDSTLSYTVHHVLL